MSTAVLDTTLGRILEHVGPPDSFSPVEIVLHGGEPLLLGHAGVREVLTRIRRRLGAPTAVTIALQTNGVRLDQTFAELFVEFGVQVGVSLDGGPEATGRHRRFTNGRNSFPHVQRSLELLRNPRYRSTFAGLLCTVDVANDPLTVLADLMAFAPPRIDFLLPHATWDHPPLRAAGEPSPYGDWLVAAFDHWYERPELAGVRLFEELIHALLGGASLSEAVGLSAPASVVVETDGTIEQTDALKVSYDGAAVTGYDVALHSFDQVLADPAVAAASFANTLSAVCLSCRWCPAAGVGSTRTAIGRQRFREPLGVLPGPAELVSHVQRQLQIDLRQQTEVSVP